LSSVTVSKEKTAKGKEFSSVATETTGAPTNLDIAAGVVKSLPKKTKMPIAYLPPDEAQKNLILSDPKFQDTVNTYDEDSGETLIILPSFNEKGEVIISTYTLSGAVVEHMASQYDKAEKNFNEISLASFEEVFDLILSQKTGTASVDGHVLATLEKDGKKVVIDLGREELVRPMAIKLINQAGRDQKDVMMEALSSGKGMPDMATVEEVNGKLIIKVGKTTISDQAKLEDGVIIWDSVVGPTVNIKRGSMVRRSVLNSTEEITLEENSAIDNKITSADEAVTVRSSDDGQGRVLHQDDRKNLAKAISGFAV